MRNKSLILLLAIVCGTVAAIGISQWMQARNTGGGSAPTIEIFVAAKAIELGEEITPEKIRLEPWPADRIPEGSVGDLKTLEGKFARQKFYAGEAVMPVKLMDTNSATIPKGFSVVAMKADVENSISNLVQPGDRVNVMAYFTKSELIPRTTTKTVLNGVRIFAIDGNTDRIVDENERPTTARTIQLLIHSGDVDAWISANELGKIRLSLGNPGDYDAAVEQEGPSEAGQEFMTWLADYQAAQEANRNAVQEPVAPQSPITPVSKKKKKDGFKMIKMVEGRMIEYWIAENELPVILNDTGAKEQTAADEELSEENQPQPNGPAAGQPMTPPDYRYLNGEDSPFFQPPAEGMSSPNGY
ncbi:Flp pilus assembly protein CpaB [Novipirellula artificiosorum]|uniref:SAF domain protein n=1 Tax=Novipirellula artificiosorum TaxID=2528016 RepID=A0A5C6DM32_9BACT|nr:Flp pilus assembly protein CpaB [Novipirellula artificiosorum]TWU35976.1 SAF domain protein [Novipirellula artificiosorum]